MLSGEFCKELRQGWKPWATLWWNFIHMVPLASFPFPFHSVILSVATEWLLGDEGEYWLGNGIGHGENFRLWKARSGAGERVNGMSQHLPKKEHWFWKQKANIRPLLQMLVSPGSPAGSFQHSKPQFPHWAHNPYPTVLTSFSCGSDQMRSSLRLCFALKLKLYQCYVLFLFYINILLIIFEITFLIIVKGLILH